MIITQFNNTSHDVEEWAFEKKKGVYLTLKQLRISDNYIILIKTSNEEKAYDLEEEVTSIVKYEDDDEVTLIKLKLSNTFEELNNLIMEEFELFDENYRLRK